MDTLLQNGDHAVDKTGLPMAVTGLGALIQRLLIRLSVRRGCFTPDLGLGSELYRLPWAAGEEAGRLALHYAQQALLPEGEARVVSAACRPLEEGALAVTVTVRVGGLDYPLEVTPA